MYSTSNQKSEGQSTPNRRGKSDQNGKQNVKKTEAKSDEPDEPEAKEKTKETPKGKAVEKDNDDDVEVTKVRIRPGRRSKVSADEFGHFIFIACVLITCLGQPVTRSKLTVEM